MKMPPFRYLVPAAAGVLGAVLATGCPSTPCPNCSLKNANFTITPQAGEIVDVVMKSRGEFKEHCGNDRLPKGCILDAEKSLGVLREDEPQSHPLPWESDEANDIITVTIDVLRRTDRGTTIQNPPVTISR